MKGLTCLASALIDAKTILLLLRVSVDTDLHTKPATNKSTSGTSLSSPVRMFNAWPVCNSQMSSNIRGTSGKLSCNQVCLEPSHSQLNVCLKTQPLERPRSSKTLIT